MALRLIDLVIPRGSSDEISGLLQDVPLLDVWGAGDQDDRSRVRILLDSQNSEAALDKLEQRFAGSERFRLVLFPLEATLPRPEERDESPEAESAEQQEATTGGRVSREELYTDITEAAVLTSAYLITVALSALVAAIGLLRGDVAIIIGAMVIAPLLSPNVAMAFATTLGDFRLGVRAMKTNTLGLLVALGVSAVLGAVVRVDPEVGAIAARCHVGLGDVGLALAAGVAGTMAFTRGTSTALIGVMVAVALLPPLVVVGLLLASAYFALAWGAFLLLATNVICINLAGVITFMAQGIHPRAWWEADRARRTAWAALALWALLLGTLLVLIWVSAKP